MVSRESGYRQFMDGLGRLSRGENRRIYNTLLGIPEFLSYPVVMMAEGKGQYISKYLESHGIDPVWGSVVALLAFPVADGAIRLITNKSYRAWSREDDQRLERQHRAANQRRHEILGQSVVDSKQEQAV
ncbi:hypothetical protein ACFLQN_03155 [Candidatus Aenigmatarchaeota archaeon]